MMAAAEERRRQRRRRRSRRLCAGVAKARGTNEQRHIALQRTAAAVSIGSAVDVSQLPATETARIHAVSARPRFEAVVSHSKDIMATVSLCSTNSTSAIHLYVSALRHTLYKCNVIPVVVASWHGPACLDARRCHPPPIVAPSLPYNTLTHEDTCTLAGGLVSEGRAAPTYPPSLMILYPSAFSASAKAWRGENGSAVAGCGT